MNLAQSFRRLEQMMSGWHESFNEQDYQLPLIKKLYKKNDLELKLTCPTCPEQYDVFKDGKQVGYLRLRHGCFTVDFPGCGDETIYEACPYGDGIFNDDERLIYLTKAMREILLKLNNE